MRNPDLPSPVQQIPWDHDITIHVKRDDLLHPVYGGNKWRKLKYNLAAMRERGTGHIVTFGGPFSNHIHAVAGISRDQGLQATMYLRGPFDDPANPVLQFVRQAGAHLIMLSRAEYARRRDVDFLDDLKVRHPDAWIIPEGGTNTLAIRGCEVPAHPLDFVI